MPGSTYGTGKALSPIREGEIHVQRASITLQRVQVITRRHSWTDRRAYVVLGCMAAL